ncbi:MAG: hypothetical protein ACE5JS_03625 [Nitrospinota bacterium]
MRRVTAYLGVLVFLAGCSFYNARPLPRGELSRSPFWNRDQSVLTVVQPLDLLEDTNEYFHADLMGEGILAFYVLIQNAGDDHIRLRRDDIRLAYHGDEPLAPTSAKLVASKVSSSKIAALRIGIMMGLGVAFLTDYKRANDYSRKELPPTMEIAPHERVAGVVFFQLKEPPLDATGCTLQFRFRNLDTPEDRAINLAILDPATPQLTSTSPRPAD